LGIGSILGIPTED